MATVKKKKMAAGGPAGSNKGCKPGMKCKDVGRSKVSSGGRKVDKARANQKKASSAFKKKEASKPRRPKFEGEYFASMKKGGSVKKMQSGGSAVGKGVAVLTKPSYTGSKPKTKSKSSAGFAKRPVKKVSGDGKAGIVLKKKQTGGSTKNPYSRTKSVSGKKAARIGKRVVKRVAKSNKKTGSKKM